MILRSIEVNHTQAERNPGPPITMAPPVVNLGNGAVHQTVDAVLQLDPATGVAAAEKAKTWLEKNWMLALGAAIVAYLVFKK